MKKINLFMRVVDIDLMADLSDVYEPLWSVQTLQLQKDCMNSDSDLQLIDVGEAHTVAASNLTRVYSYGWNDCYQLGKPIDKRKYIYSPSPINLPIEQARAKSLAVGDNHNLLVDAYGNLYVWGDNSKGQLGLGHSRDMPKISILDFLQNDTISEIKAKGNNSLVVTEQGKAYYWPIQKESGEIITKPVEMTLPPKIQVATAACGYNFAALVSKNGLVFTFGRDNQFGQLGHGDTKPREIPTLVESLKNDGEKISSVACGYKHVICKTSLGKVYTWGWGEMGQLGHDNFENLYTPKIVSAFSSTFKNKTLMVQAGFKHSMVLTETKKVFWWGTNATIDRQPVPVELNFAHKIPDMNNEFFPVRILCAWSKTLNVSYVTIADCRTSELHNSTKHKVLGTLISKFEEKYAFNDIDPPYTESIAKYFLTRIMKTVPSQKEKKMHKENLKMAAKQSQRSLYSDADHPGLPHYTQSLSKIRLDPSGYLPLKEHFFNREEEESRAQLNQRNYDTFSPEKVYSREYLQASPSFHQTTESDRELRKEVESVQSHNSEQIEQLSAKLKEIKRRMDDILRIPRDQWNETDLEFMRIATEPKMFSLLKSIQ